MEELSKHFDKNNIFDFKNKREKNKEQYEDDKKYHLNNDFINKIISKIPEDYNDLEKVLIFYDKAASKLNTICNFDMGGGTPLPTDYSVNYEEFADLVIRELMKLTDKYHVKHPNLISENGKYSQK